MDSVVGIISDTHGLLRPEALEALRGSQLIIHAGDIGAPQILQALARIAPVRAIRGNIDLHPTTRKVGAWRGPRLEPWAEGLPETDVVGIGGAHLYVLHDLKQLDLSAQAAGFAAVISGHSHHPGQKVRQGVLYFNPGSAGPRRFRLPVSVGRLYVSDGRVRGEIVLLAV